MRSAREKVGDARSTREGGGLAALDTAETPRGGDAAVAVDARLLCCPPRAPLDLPLSSLQSIGLLAHHWILHHHRCSLLASLCTSAVYRERERVRMRSRGESKREGEGAAEEPSLSLPHPLALDPPTIVTLIPTAPVGLG